MQSVVFKYCADYNVPRIEALIRESLALLNLDVGKEISGKKVLLKPNLLAAYLPSMGVTTHPSFIEAIIRILKDFDCKLWLGDSPNGVQVSLEDVWQRTGMSVLCERYGVEKKFFEREGATPVGDLLISNVPLMADYIINLPKFKTHGLTVMTGAVKNMFGMVPGLKKASYHRIHRKDFGNALVRIAEARRPDLNIVDGITAMAGNGPSGGELLNVALIAAGQNMHHVDLALAKLAGIEPRDVDTLAEAEGLGLVDLKSEIEFLGDDLSKFDMTKFKLPVSYTSKLRERGWFNFLVKRFASNMHVKPRIIKETCEKCGMCVKICPVSAIKYIEGFPNVENDDCIECYCCHETCPAKSIELRESLFFKIDKAISSRRRRQ